MRPLVRGLATLSIAGLLAACGGTSPTAAPTSVAPTTGPVATAVPTSAPVATQQAEVCAETTEPTVVEASVGGFAWGAVTAKVGDVVTWTNGDGVPHKLAFDDGTCTMDGNIAGGGSRSLVFSKPGTFAFHCTLHGQMPGSITITE